MPEFLKMRALRRFTLNGEEMYKGLPFKASRNAARNLIASGDARPSEPQSELEREAGERKALFARVLFGYSRR
jgi:hypothetical protein